MEQHGMSHFSHGLNGTFSDAILMMGADTAEVNFLFHGGNVCGP
jgi:hypothetical protein